MLFFQYPMFSQRARGGGFFISWLSNIYLFHEEPILCVSSIHFQIFGIQLMPEHISRFNTTLYPVIPIQARHCRIS
jgi:hypothetical protein